MLQTKFGWKQASGFGYVVWKCEQTLDAGLPAGPTMKEVVFFLNNMPLPRKDLGGKKTTI